MKIGSPFVLLALVGVLLGGNLALVSAADLRPPAVPLVTHDPYFSIWLMSDKPTDDWTKHWTGRNQPLLSMVRIDGKTFRLLAPLPRRYPPLPFTGMKIYPTRTVFNYAGEGVGITLTFLSPLLAADLDVMSRPVTYVSFDVASTDGKSHEVSLYFDAGAEVAVNSPEQKVVWSRLRQEKLDVLAIGCKDQQVLEKSGDDLRIDWGYFYLGLPPGLAAQTVIADAWTVRLQFADSGTIPAGDDMRMPRVVNDGYPVAAAVFPLGKVGAEKVTRHLLLAYDDQFAVEYFYRKLRPYWRLTRPEIGDLLPVALAEYDGLDKRCAAFDEELLADLRRCGGEEYAVIGALAYRQSIAAHKLAADIDGTPLFFPKENFSNGCISTVDVIYPAAPQYLLFNPKLVEAMLVPVFEYARSRQWPFPFAPHDLGTYPQANGQVYGGGNRSEKDQMPVEESGNLIILAAALAKAQGNPAFALRYWEVLEKWAGYLKEKGLNPEEQLCTDDFAGHLAHNANLSIKAIVALKSFAYLCGLTGQKEKEKAYDDLAGSFAAQWRKKADDGDHSRLAFDAPGTWSQKYNLVWDKILGFNLFPAEVAKREIEYYKKKQLAYGLPLDNRKNYTKLDWIFWTATLADNPEDFRSFITPVWSFLHATPDRVPMTDWYWADSGRQVGFQARPVVGGVFIRLLADPVLWRAWVQRSLRPGQPVPKR